MSPDDRKLWDLLASPFAGEWARISEILLGQSLREGGSIYKLKVFLTADFDVFPIGDWDSSYFSPAEDRGPMPMVVESVLSQLRASATRANEVRLWHESFMNRAGQRLLIRGDRYTLSSDMKDYFRPTAFRPGTDMPGGPAYMDFLPTFKAADHRVMVDPGTVAVSREWRNGYLLADLPGGRSIWVPCWHFRPSLLDGNNAMKPIVGTEHSIWI